MNHLTKVFSLATLFLLCLFAVSCDDDDGCTTYYLTKSGYGDVVDEFYYHDDGLLDVVIQNIQGFPPRRNKYTYDDNRRLIRVDFGTDLWWLEFSYDNSGRVELIRMYAFSNSELTREIKYFYGGDCRVSKREIHEDDELIYYNSYEYVSDNELRVETVNLQDDKESVLVYTMDDNPTPYPREYNMGWESLGGITTSGNVTSLQTFKDGVLDASQSYTMAYEYNEGGYPIGYQGGPLMYTYSCEPVKEP